MNYFISYYIKEGDKLLSCCKNSTNLIPDEHIKKIKKIITFNKKENIFQDYGLCNLINLEILEISRNSKIINDFIPNEIAKLQKLYLIKNWKPNRERTIQNIGRYATLKEMKSVYNYFNITNIGYKIFENNIIIFDISTIIKIPENITKINFFNLTFDNDSILKISDYNKVSNIFNNLPVGLERLQIYTDYFYFSDLCKSNKVLKMPNIFDNLPISLKKIVILTPEIENKTADELLKNIKVPFDCKIKIKFIKPWIIYRNAKI